MNYPERLSPTDTSSRYHSLDLLRGIAVLGILIMNIQSYSMIEAAYLNPTAYGDFSGVNKIVWMLSHILADQKFMTIFSILFGAGIVLFSERIEAKGIKPAGLHYRRTLWLLVFGLFHAYLLWYGDILVPYAMCALIVYLFRKKSPKILFIIGLILVSIAFFIALFSGWSMKSWPTESVEELMYSWYPPESAVMEELSTYRGSWLEQMVLRVPTAIMIETFFFLFLTFWRVAGLMLIGMALYKWGVLTAQKSKRFYINCLLIGFAIGLSLIGLGLQQNISAKFSIKFSFFLGSQFNYWGSVFVAFGYISAVMLISKLLKTKKVKNLFEGVGRTAFSNYLLQTFICTTIFYGHGFGLFGSVERGTQILIVFAVWIFQIFITNMWLKHFRFGPAEWLWRSLTYWHLQPMRKNG